MKFSIKKHQKSSLTLISIALFSVSSISQAGYNSSRMHLCMQNSTFDKEYYRSIGASEAFIETNYNINETSIREELREQVYLNVRSFSLQYYLEPVFITSEASIINTDPSNPINLYKRKEMLKNPGDWMIHSNIILRSFDRDPSQVLTGKTTILGPGLHFISGATRSISDLPPIRKDLRLSCAWFSDSDYEQALYGTPQYQ